MNVFSLSGVDLGYFWATVYWQKCIAPPLKGRDRLSYFTVAHRVLFDPIHELESGEINLASDDCPLALAEVTKGPQTCLWH